MNGRQRCPILALLSLALAVAPGCHGTSGSRRPRYVGEPPLIGEADTGGAVLSPAPVPGAATVPTTTFVDRHPLFYKPREYYQSSGDNRLVKIGAATVVGIPAGLLGEVRQIVVGRPQGEIPY